MHKIIKFLVSLSKVLKAITFLIENNCRVTRFKNAVQSLLPDIFAISMAQYFFESPQKFMNNLN
ncbi:MAG: hypothetical protein AMK71_13290 [Nitrospira bacterium SG8_35_4]|nr:MAG: hypothetical protein AMK71_13290 [Nitrospira bacterium SG8_35_4]